MDETGGPLVRFNDCFGKSFIGVNSAIINFLLEAVIPSVKWIQDIETTTIDDSFGSIR